jgi:hypothetical protein
MCCRCLQCISCRPPCVLPCGQHRVLLGFQQQLNQQTRLDSPWHANARVSCVSASGLLPQLARLIFAVLWRLRVCARVPFKQMPLLYSPPLISHASRPAECNADTRCLVSWPLQAYTCAMPSPHPCCHAL